MATLEARPPCHVSHSDSLPPASAPLPPIRHWPVRQPQTQNRSIWLISFTDLMCLLLAFFVLRFSMTEPQSQRWQALTESLAPPGPGKGGAMFNVSQLASKAPLSLDYLANLMSVLFGDVPEFAGIVPVRLSDRFVLPIPDNALFQPGQATFSERGQRILFALGGVLGHTGNRIEITGHADQENATSPGGRDMWELSLSRAVTVGRALQAAGYQHRLVIRTQGAGAATNAHLIDVVVRDMAEGH